MNLKPIANIQKTDRYFFILSCSFQIAFLTNCHFENGNQHIAKWGNMKDKKLTLILFLLLYAIQFMNFEHYI